MLRSKTPYILFVWVALGVGCAAQNARYTQKRAEQLLKQVETERPNTAEAREAKTQLAVAKKHLSAARYDRAEAAFRASIEASETALETPAPENFTPPPATAPEMQANSAAPSAEVAPVPAPASTEPAKPSVIVPPPAKTAKPEFSKPETPVVSKRGLPAQALAKYLASKRALMPRKTAEAKQETTATAETEVKAESKSNSKVEARSETKAEAKSEMKHEAKPEVKTEAKLEHKSEARDSEETPRHEAAPAKESPVAEKPEVESSKEVAKNEKPVAPKPVVTARESKLPGSGSGKTGLIVEGEGIEGDSGLEANTHIKPKVVDAPATKVNKKAPERENLEEKLAEAPKEQAKPAAKVLSKRRIPGSIEFKLNDPSLLGDAMTNLDQTSKFLLDNPSTTLVLQGVAVSGELSNLIDSRYESVRSYLTAKGVPDDQIRLDPERKSGKAPQFELFLIEH